MGTGNIINKAQFTKQPVLEQQFEDRYGRKADIYRAITLGENGLLEHVTVHVHRKGKQGQEKYTITEYLKKDQSTDYVLSGRDGDPRQYRDYLSAEVYVADLIGQQIRGEK